MPSVRGVDTAGPMRDQLRAVLILLHVLAVGFLALPQPGVFMHERQWRQPEVQQVFRAVSQGLGTVGYTMPPADVHALAWDLGTEWKSGRRRIARYLQPYVKYCGIKQGWSMFAHVPWRSGRLEVELDDGTGEWRPIYVSQDPEHDWQGRVLRQERMRAYISDFAWRRRKGVFPRLAEALALRAAEDFPEATRLRARMVTVQIPGPAALRQTGELEVGEPYFEAVVALGDYR